MKVKNNIRTFFLLIKANSSSILKATARIVEPAYEDDSHFITQLLGLTPVINIHQEIDICVHSDLC